MRCWVDLAPVVLPRIRLVTGKGMDFVYGLSIFQLPPGKQVSKCETEGLSDRELRWIVDF